MNKWTTRFEILLEDMILVKSFREDIGAVASRWCTDTREPRLPHYNMAVCNKLPAACPVGRLGTTFHFIIALLLPCEIHRFMVVLRDHPAVDPRLYTRAYSPRTPRDFYPRYMELFISDCYSASRLTSCLFTTPSIIKSRVVRREL